MDLPKFVPKSASIELVDSGCYNATNRLRIRTEYNEKKQILSSIQGWIPSTSVLGYGQFMQDWYRSKWNIVH